MKKILFGFATLLLGSSLIYGYDAEFQYEPAVNQTEQVAVSSESSYGLTPKRPQTIALAQHVPVPMPTPAYHNDAPRLADAAVTTVALRTETPLFQPEPISGGIDPYVYAELERMSSAIQRLQKDTAKPDPRKSFSAPKLSGRMFFDSYSISEPGDANNYQNKLGLRELRLTLTGTGYEAFDYKAEFNFAPGGVVNFNDLWIGAKNVPLLGYFRVGHYNLEISPAYLAGTSHTTLMETTAPATSFFLARRLGMSSEHLFAKDRIRWFVGVFQGESIHNARSHQLDNQGYIINTRLSAAPYYANGGRQVLHVGGFYAYLDTRTPVGVTSYLGGSNWLETTLTTGTTHVSKRHHRSGLELAYQSGPFAAKSEAFFAQYGRYDIPQGGGIGPSRQASGASVELTYFLTGEHRAYSLASGTFGAATVNRPFRPFRSNGWNLVDGPGAWQFVTQYSYVDLGDWRTVTGAGADSVTGGYQHDLTFGMNWFWTSNLRWVFAYTRSQQDVWTAPATRQHRSQDVVGVSARVHW